MTGFGSAVCQEGDWTVSAEIKTVNNRHFKLLLKITDGYAAFEQRIEPLLRTAIERGTVSVNIRIQNEQKDAGFKINMPVLQSYAKQLTEVAAKLGQHSYVPPLEKLVFLPGAVKTNADNGDNSDQAGKILDQTVKIALNILQNMRKTEGRSMAKDLSANLDSLSALIGIIENRTQHTVAVYQQKLKERLEKALTEHSVTLNDSDLIREIAIYADRCDISEETVRFRSHLEQFAAAINAEESCGRKLDFLTQELFREANTIGAKANDLEITKNVVEIKAVIERIREMVQNVE
jgi:uncharacterized protein (TIGR00255 family)